jgi:hypothetical protein
MEKKADYLFGGDNFFDYKINKFDKNNDNVTLFYPSPIPTYTPSYQLLDIEKYFPQFNTNFDAAHHLQSPLFPVDYFNFIYHSIFDEKAIVIGSKTVDVNPTAFYGDIVNNVGKKDSIQVGKISINTTLSLNK